MIKSTLFLIIKKKKLPGRSSLKMSPACLQLMDQIVIQQPNRISFHIAVTVICTAKCTKHL